MKKSAVTLLHLGYWLLYLILVGFFIQVMPNLRKPPLVHMLFFSQVGVFALFPGLTGFYSFYFILFPRFLRPKKIVNLIFFGMMTTIVCGLATLFLLALLFNFRWYLMGVGSMAGILTFESLLALVHGIIALVMNGFIGWYGDIKLKEELNKRNYEMELALVKSQVNPHFLFNTLNNIDVLIEKDTAKASLYFKKLSDILRFMLYETKTEKIPLSKELTYIEKFIDLQKIRTANPNYVNYLVEGETRDMMIAPMLFIPFVENAFKHAGNKKIENAIDIRFLIEKNKITFNCENCYDENGYVSTGGDGLGNGLIRKRLMLLYPDRHTLEIMSANKMYKAKLIIDNNAD